MENIVLGLDIGITSVGWALMDDETNQLIEFGVRKFEEAIPAADARVSRSARRTNRRKKWRKNQLKEAFNDFNIISNEELKKKGYLSFTATHKKGVLDENIEEINAKTIYHLRKKGLTEELSKRELFLCLYNITKTRGHFLIENVDFTKNNIREEDIIDDFIKICENHVEFLDNIKEFESEVLKIIINDNFSSKDIDRMLKKQYVDNELDEKANKKLNVLLKIISGYVGDLSIIDESLTKTSINKIKSTGSENDLEIALTNIYDMIQTKRILAEGYNYLCEKHVDMLDKLEQYGEIDYTKIENDEEFKEYYQDIRKKMSFGDDKKVENKNKLRVIKNIENNYPNGLYLKEAIQILKCQQEKASYKDMISEDFIEVVCEIISAKIPYYMGPLSSNAKNGWIERKDEKIKYSYNYMLKNSDVFDEVSSVKKWKENMISRCTYLPDEFALPKQSFIGELFTILNDLCIYKGVKNGDEYFLTKKEKIKVINELFLKKSGTIKFSDVEDVLELESFRTRSNQTIVKFNKTFSLYFDIIKIVEELEIDDIFKEITDFEHSKIKAIEEIIMSLVLYDDMKNKYIEFIKMGYTEEEAQKLSKLNSKDFLSLSRKFIMETPMNVDGEFLIEILLNDYKKDVLNDNGEQVANEQQSIINNAVDLNGNRINFSANKYEKLLEKENKLGINLLMDDGKPFVPMARPVIRGLNETMKIYNDIIKYYGVPSKVVIETAKELGDFKETKTPPAKHFDEVKKLYENLEKQNKENKINSKNLEEWNEVQRYLVENKRKIELYVRQNGECMITGNKIDLNNLVNYQIDHILPRGFGDNSMNNLMLIEGAINNKKNNRVPLEYIKADNPGIYQSFVKRVEYLYNIKMISFQKRETLLLENQEEVIGFIQRNLVDTRYIIKEFSAILRAYNKYNNYDTKIRMLQGSYNSIYRNALNFRKNREVGDQHHAHDAGIIIIVDKCLETLYPNYSSGNEFNAKRYSKILNNFITEDKEVKYGNNSNAFFRKLYIKAFGNDYRENNSFVSELKQKVPLLSWKIEKKSSGELFNATIYGQDTVKFSDANLKAYAKKINYNFETENYLKELYQEYGEKDVKKELIELFGKPLDIIGVNDDKKIFSSVNSVAVDFYKLTINKGTKKEKKKHFAVHIPKAIVQNGVINEAQYIDLVKRHYNYLELFDKNGELITGAFKFRIYKNEMYYDTERNELHRFNIGSITNKILEIKRLNIYSYNDVYDLVEEMKLNFKKENIFIEQKLFNEFIEEIIIFYTSKGYQIDFMNNYLIETYKKAEKINIFSLFETIAKALLDSKNIMNTLKINGQNTLTINNVKLPDTEYIKIASSSLGIRFIKQDNKKPIIVGRHKKIKKTQFTWQV